MLFEKILFQSAGSFSVAVVALLMMIMQALFFLRRPQISWYAWSSAISFSALLYSIGIFLEYNTTQGPLNRFAGTLEYTAIIFLIHCLFGFTFSYLKVENKLYHLIAGIFHLIILILLWSTNYIVSEKFIIRHFIDLQTPYIEPDIGPLGLLFMSYAAVAGLYAMIIWIRHKSPNIKHRIPYLVGMGFWILLGIHDGLAAMGLHTFQYLMEYGFVGFAMVVLWVVFNSYLEIEAEEKYRVITEFANDCIVIIQDGKMVFGNPACSDLTGLSLHDSTAREFFDIVVPEDREKVRENYYTLMEGGNVPKHYGVRFRRSDKEERFVEVTSSLIEYRDSPAVLAVLRDITERKYEEEALRESEDRYRALFDQAADSIVIIDPESGILEGFNEKAYKDLGYTREEFEKFRITDFANIESEAEVKKHLEKILNEGSDRFETRHRTKEGEVRDVFVNSRSIWLNGKNFIQSIWRDITEIKRFERVLKTTNAELQEAYKKLGGAYTQMREWKDRLSTHIQGEETGIIIDKDGRILGITERVLECTGLNTIELLQSNILDLIRRESKQNVKKAIRDAWAGIYNQTSFLMIGADPNGKEFKAKLMKISLIDERQIMILMRRSELEERSVR